MPNRRQKPPHLLQGKGSRYTGTSLVQLRADDSRPIPIPPPRLRKVARDAWQAFWRSPMAKLVEDDSDMDAIRDWAFLVSERERLRSLTRGQELVIGSTGQLVENPLLRTIDRYSKQIDRYREAFGMTPLSRMRLGIAVGEAHDSLAALAGSLGGDEPETFDLAEFDDARVIEVGS